MSFKKGEYIFFYIFHVFLHSYWCKVEITFQNWTSIRLSLFQHDVSCESDDLLPNSVECLLSSESCFVPRWNNIAHVDDVNNVFNVLELFLVRITNVNSWFRLSNAIQGVKWTPRIDISESYVGDHKYSRSPSGLWKTSDQ